MMLMSNQKRDPFLDSGNNAELIQSQQKIDVQAWCCSVELEYLATQQCTNTVPIFLSNTPNVLYRAATQLNCFIQDSVAVVDKSKFYKLNAALFRQSFSSFKVYFEQQNDALQCNAQQFAICANEYAILQLKLGHFQDAARISNEGLNYFESVDLHVTRVEALLKQADYDNADRALKQYFYRYTEETAPYYKHQLQLSHQIVVNNHQCRRNALQQKAEELLFGLYAHATDAVNITERGYRDLNTAKGHLENTIYGLIGADHVAERIKYFEDILLRYPSESQPYYMLMQEYSDVNQFEKMKYAAERYLFTKKAFLLSNTDKNKARYLILKSYFSLNQFIEGAAYFERYEQDIFQSMDEEDRVHLLGYMVQIYAKLNNLERVIDFVKYIERVYETRQWDYDGLIEKIYLTEAELFYGKGELKLAHKLLEKVLVYTDYDPIASKFKQEWKKPNMFAWLF